MKADYLMSKVSSTPVAQENFKSIYHWYADDFHDSPDKVTTINRGVITLEYYACWITRLAKELEA